MLSTNELAHIKKVNDAFEYETDRKNYGVNEVWTTISKTGKGDCEDYALTIRKETGGDIYVCKLNNDGHAVLKLPNGTWIDNIHREPVVELSTNTIKYTDFRKVSTLELYFRLFSGKIITFVKGL